MTDSPPKIDNALGLTWALRKLGWEARWRARKDLVRSGYQTKSVPLYRGWEPDAGQIAYIQTMCRRLQDEMLEWSRGGNLLRFEAAFDGTLGSLIDCYRSDEDSDYRKLRYHTRVNCDRIYDRLQREHGTEMLSELDARTFIRWHRERKGDKNHVSAAHTLVTKLRTVLGYGAVFLKEKECPRLRAVLSGMKFEMTKPRTEQITPEQADAVRAMAHATGRHSIALAQALAFECTMRQKDVIGEYVPQSEPGISDVPVGNDKWLRGLRWGEIDDNFILRHLTSKKQKPIECDLRLAPMVMEELAFFAGIDPAKAASLSRSDLPAKGPIVICELTGVPYTDIYFRRQWRKVATMAGIPREVFNMDSRAGAITEATDAGAELEHVKHAAAHSNISQTQQYSRGAAKKVAGVMRLRVANRNKSGTDIP
jgi:hypothetical protein